MPMRTAIRGEVGVGQAGRESSRPVEFARERVLRSLGEADLSMRYVAFRARRRLRLLKTLAEAADKKWTVAPAETVMTAPSICLPGQAEKARQTCPNTSWDVERIRVSGGKVMREAVVAYQLSNAALVYGSILCGAGERRVVPYERGLPADLSPVADFREGALSGSYLGLLYFGHWLRDDSSLELLAAEFSAPITLRPPSDWVHCDAYRRILSLSSQTVTSARFKRLVIFDDEDFSAHKTERLRKLRERAAKASKRTGPRLVFLKRGLRDNGARHFLNEEDVAAALAKDGFTIIDPLKSDVATFAETLGSADIVVGPEGSQLGHAALFLREGAGLLAITPPRRFVTGHKRWCDQLGIRYGLVMGDEQEEGFTANVGDVKRTIDLYRV